MCCFVFAVQSLTSFFVSFLSSDIKPENLLISSDDILKLCDFGKFFHHSATLFHITRIMDFFLRLWGRLNYFYTQI